MMDALTRKSMEVWNLLDAIVSSYFGDVTTSIWYKEYQMEFQVYRLFQSKVGMKVIVRKNNESVFVAENDNVGEWKDKTWGLRLSTVASIIEEAVKHC